MNIIYIENFKKESDHIFEEDNYYSIRITEVDHHDENIISSIEIIEDTLYDLDRHIKGIVNDYEIIINETGDQRFNKFNRGV